MSDQVINYLKENREHLLGKLSEFLSIPSISTDSSHNEDVLKAGNFVVDYLKEIGFNKVELQKTPGHPLVYGEWLEAEGAPTVLFYGHYDVQPADPLELWESDPFKAAIRNDKIFARGASDDKGQVFMNLAVFEAYMKTEGRLPINVKVCIEGEEEIGSKHLGEVLQQQKEKFQADFAVISDSGMVEAGQPTILYGLKGFTGLEFTVTGPNRDLHSGIYGGAAKNPAMALCHMIASLKNEEEQVTVPGFYDGVEELQEEERRLMNESPGENYTQTIGIPETTPEKGYTAKEHTMARPTLEINGMYSGYQGEGTKTIIPSTATAKITCRLVPGQDPDVIQQLMVDHLEKVAPKGVKLDIHRYPLSAKAYKMDPSHPLLKKASTSYSEAFGKEAVFVRLGGSIPVVELIDQLFQIPVVLLGFGTPEDNLHSPNESFPLESFDKGMEVLASYYRNAAQV
ncbi:acetylornithine deacetylase/succinyl-diaminopimelate desuccinylase-like protein [Evansella vedderi]|uniref:Acetylornithine deacetylase/succinyl-diaminopimelate desuccinylase-like protein n=1 Tax=Evansella vedderi TaxID=38282 RepID=A0ABT9ZX03_9BACI|nr:dipeptidase [Evansella vedderi]MDQ0255768.1 acetylornithine deacetylase/succinyl-diaminopimelate desuccinylase-like protein [Evansella vedderi]